MKYSDVREISRWDDEVALAIGGKDSHFFLFFD